MNNRHKDFLSKVLEFVKYKILKITDELVALSKLEKFTSKMKIINLTRVGN